MNFLTVTMETNFDWTKIRRIVLFLTITFINLILWSCEPKKGTSSPAPSSPYKVLWKTPLVTDFGTDYSLSSNPAFYGSSVAVSTQYPLQGLDEPVLFIDTGTGQITHLWSDYIDGTAGHQYESSAQYNEFLILKTMRSIDCINLKTKSTQWSTKLPNSNSRVYLHKSYVYTSNWNKSQKKAQILRSPIDRENWEIVYSYLSPNQYIPSFTSFAFGEDKQGNEIIVWKNRSYTGAQKQTDIFAYNLNQDSLLWTNTEFKVFSGVSPLIVEGDRVYGLVQEKAFCLDLTTGNTIWTNNFKGLVPNPRMSSFDQGSLHLSDQHLILKGNEPELLMLFKNDGGLYRRNDHVPGGMINIPTYFEGKIFGANSHLIILDEKTGELLIDPNAPGSDFGLIASKIVIDPQRRVMYFHNGQFLFCVKIPEGI